MWFVPFFLCYKFQSLLLLSLYPIRDESWSTMNTGFKSNFSTILMNSNCVPNWKQLVYFIIFPLCSIFACIGCVWSFNIPYKEKLGFQLIQFSDNEWFCLQDLVFCQHINPHWPPPKAQPILCVTILTKGQCQLKTHDILLGTDNVKSNILEYLTEESLCLLLSKVCY